MRAEPSLNKPVRVQATRINASILPHNIFSQSYLLYVINQGTDVGAIADKANQTGAVLMMRRSEMISRM